MHTCARGCTCIRWHLKETVLWGTNTYMKWENKTYKLKRTFSTIPESCVLQALSITIYFILLFVMDFFQSFSHKKNICGSQKQETNLDWVQLPLLELLRQGLPSWHPFCLWLISVLVSPHHCYYHLLHLDSSFQSLFQNHHCEIINGASLFWVKCTHGLRQAQRHSTQRAVTLFKYIIMI